MRGHLVSLSTLTSSSSHLPSLSLLSSPTIFMSVCRFTTVSFRFIRLHRPQADVSKANLQQQPVILDLGNQFPPPLLVPLGDGRQLEEVAGEDELDPAEGPVVPLHRPGGLASLGLP